MNEVDSVFAKADSLVKVLYVDPSFFGSIDVTWHMNELYEQRYVL